MMTRRRMLTVITAFIAVCGVAGFNLAQAKGPSTGTRIEGILTGVNLDSSSVVIRSKGGASAIVAVAAVTKIERNGRRVPLSALRIGDTAQARITAGVTTKLESVGP